MKRWLVEEEEGEKNRIESIIAGTRGMAIVTERLAYVSSENKNGAYTLSQQPAFLINYKDNYCDLIGKNSVSYNFKTRMTKSLCFIMMLSIIYAIAFSKIGEGIIMTGMLLLGFGCFTLISMGILELIRISIYKEENAVAKRKYALYKAINAYRKYGRIPALDEIKKASAIVSSEIEEIKPIQCMGIFNTFFGIFFMANGIGAKFIVFLFFSGAIIALKFHNVLCITSLSKANEKELNEARDVIKYFCENKDMGWFL